MPGYVNYSPWEDAANFGQGATTGLAQLALQIPQMRAQQMMIRSKMAQVPFETDLLQAQAGEARARMGEATSRGSEADSRAGLYDEQTEAVKQKTKFNADGAQSLGEIFQAVQSGQTPSPESMVNIGKFLASKNPAQVAEMMKQVTAMGASHLATNPSLASAIAVGDKRMGVNIPSGATYHPQFGGADVQAGVTLAPGAMRFPGSGSPAPGTPVAVNTNQAPHSLSSALDVQFARMLADGSITTNDIPQLRAILGSGQLQQPGTNAAPAQPAVPPPHQRQLGDKVTTSKGTFQWNGLGWDPVATQQVSQ